MMQFELITLMMLIADVSLCAKGFGVVRDIVK